MGLAFPTPPTGRAEVAWPQVGPLDTTAVGQARGLMLLAQACDAVGVQPVSLSWRSFHGVERAVQVSSRRELDRLADHLGFPASASLTGDVRTPTATREGVWQDMRVRVYGPAADAAEQVA